MHGQLMYLSNSSYTDRLWFVPRCLSCSMPFLLAHAQLRRWRAALSSMRRFKAMLTCRCLLLLAFLQMLSRELCDVRNTSLTSFLSIFWSRPSPTWASQPSMLLKFNRAETTIKVLMQSFSIWAWLLSSLSASRPLFFFLLSSWYTSARILSHEQFTSPLFSFLLQVQFVRSLWCTRILHDSV